MKIIKLSALFAVLVFTGSVNAQIGCDRACLSGHLDTYFNALISNNPNIVPLASGAKISDNNV